MDATRPLSNPRLCYRPLVPFEPTLRKQICQAAAHLYDRGHGAPGDGNISVRLSERYLLTTPTGEHKGQLEPTQLVKVRFATGEGVDGSPSSELRMHLAIYRGRPDIRAIVHAHSPHTVGLTVSGHSLEAPVVPEAIQALGGIPTVPYASPTTEAVANAVLPYALTYNAFVLERHGPVTLGASLPEAMARLEVVEHTAQITAIGLATGGAEPIGESEASRLRQLAMDAGLLRSPDAPKRQTSTAGVSDALLSEVTRRVLERLKFP